MVSLKIRTIYVNGYGIHNNRTFQLDTDAQVTVFYGRNEAGKSTLMSFIRSVLFGFPKRNYKAERYEPLRGGLYGGALTLLDQNGAQIRLERYENNSSLKLLYPDGTEAGEPALQSLLGGLSADLYKNLFAFSLSELQRLDTLQTEEISGFLFSAGMGMSGGRLAQFERKLHTQMDGLYKPRGKQSINEQLRIVEQSEQELRLSKEKIGQYQVWQEQLINLDLRIEADERELSQYRTELDWINKCWSSRDSWVQLLEVEKELSLLPPLTPLPEDVLIRFEKAQDELERTNMEQQAIQQARLAAQGQLNELVVNEQLIEMRNELEPLLEASALYDDNMLRMTEGLAEVEGHQTELNRYLRFISTDWTEEQLQRFPLSIHHREQVEAYAGRFSSYHHRRQSRTIEQEHLIEQLEQHQSMVEEQQLIRNVIQQRMDNDCRISLERDQLQAYENEVRKLWDHTRKQATNMIHMEQRVSDALRNEQILSSRRNPEQRRVSSTKSQYLIVKLMAIVINIGIPLWLIIGLSSWMTGIIVFLLLTMITGYLWLRSSKPVSRIQQEDSLYQEAITHREQLQQEAKQLRAQWGIGCERLYNKLREYVVEDDNMRFQAAASRSWKANDPTTNGDSTDVHQVIQQLEQQFDSLMYEIDKYKQIDAELYNVDQKLNLTGQAIAALNQRLAAMKDINMNEQQEERSLYEEWERWLGQYELPPTLSVDAMTIMIQYAESGVKVIDRIKRINNKLAIYEQSRRNFEHQSTMLLRQLGIVDNLPANQLVYELKRQKGLIDDQVNRMEKRQLVIEQIKDLDSREQLYTNKVTHLRDKLKQLLDAANAYDEEELRKFVRLHDRRDQLQQQKRNLKVVIFTWMKEEDQQRLFTTLEQFDADQLRHQMAGLEETMIQLEVKLNENKDRRGGLRKEMDNLQSGGQHAELLQRHQEHITELQQMVSQWAELALSGTLIRQAKEIYERERQPGVLLRASHYMRLITDGQFIRVVSKIGEKSIFVERGNGERLESTWLSRGTAEQLYLAMRFALADEYARTVSLPLIMDDIFVNFDAERLTQTLSVLNDVAKRHQIILFTCHDHVRRELLSALSNVQIIDLEDEGVSVS